MDERELECHLAAGTDLPTAFATVDREPSGGRGLAVVGFVAALLAGLLILWLMR
jgi:hypothetical protein